jgi:serine/threonine protein kinase
VRRTACVRRCTRGRHKRWELVIESDDWTDPVKRLDVGLHRVAASHVDSERNFGPWLTTIAKRPSVDIYRRETDCAAIPLDPVPTDDPPLATPSIAVVNVSDVCGTARRLAPVPRRARRRPRRHFEGTHAQICEGKTIVPVLVVCGSHIGAHEPTNRRRQAAVPQVLRVNPMTLPDTHLLTDIIESVLRRDSADWRTRNENIWCHVYVPDQTLGLQGWKLHVSATPLSAAYVLSRAATLLVTERCRFKFARTIDGVAELVSPRAARGAAGKFITAYPQDDEQLLELAQALHAATSGLPGPRILSDWPHAPGSLVHYRYGVFSGTPVLTNDGSYEARLLAPDGSLVSDRRDAWFSPPVWAAFPGANRRARPATVTRYAASRSVVLAGRYEIKSAIQHASKGGVYRGIDTATGGEVLIKHARAHIASTLSGTDARDVLRSEAMMLERLSAITPRLLAMVEREGDQFLVEEMVQGSSLRHWVAERIDELDEPDAGLPPALTLRYARQLTRLLEVAHQLGVVLRDFNPNNIVVASDRTLRLVDLECVTYPGAPTFRAFTVPYAPDEVLALPAYGPAPSQSADLHSLGVTMFYLATALDPVFADDDPPIRSTAQRLRRLIDCLAVRNEGLRLLAPAIVALTDEDPDRRWNLAQVRESLAAAEHSLSGAVADARTRRQAWWAEELGRLSAERDELITEGLEHVLESMSGEDQRLWPSGSFGSTTDACNVQHGAAGVLAVLARAYEARPDARLREGVRSVADWLSRTVRARPSTLPGLYFGRSGAAWALFEAGRVLDAPELVTTALEMARSLPVRWPNPDVCHGAAGAGMTLLHLWKGTGDPELRERVVHCADGLLAASQRHAGGLVWPIASDFDSKLAGLCQLGFAHGVAGIGAFLLSAGTHLGEPRYRDAARRAGVTLVEAAMVRKGEALWHEEPAAVGEPGRASLHWCSGASGIATFLVRLWRAGGDDRHRRLAELAAVAVYRRRWHGSPVMCHGVAGNAEFLLDLAAAGCGERYRDWADEMAACIYVRHAIRRGRRVVADETQREVTVDFNTGLAGVLALLLRLSHGGPRWFMPVDLELPAVARPAEAAAA